MSVFFSASIDLCLCHVLGMNYPSELMSGVAICILLFFSFFLPFFNTPRVSWVSKQQIRIWEPDLVDAVLIYFLWWYTKENMCSGSN